MNQRRTVRLPTERILPSDVTVYKYRMLSKVFSISRVATYWQRNSCYDLCNDTRVHARVMCTVLSPFLLTLKSLT
jgi:hypothetical protein